MIAVTQNFCPTCLFVAGSHSSNIHRLGCYLDVLNTLLGLPRVALGLPVGFSVIPHHIHHLLHLPFRLFQCLGGERDLLPLGAGQRLALLIPLLAALLQDTLGPFDLPWRRRRRGRLFDLCIFFFLPFGFVVGAVGGRQSVAGRRGSWPVRRGEALGPGYVVFGGRRGRGRFFWHYSDLQLASDLKNIVWINFLSSIKGL